MENSVNLVICESAIGTINNAVKLPLCMESESELIVHSFTIRDILSPRELDLVTISVEFWRGDDWMEIWGNIVISSESICFCGGRREILP